ncbi:hypothetical protein BGW80DRAFT_1558760 [Lactifluus volemus]|nr:hypothetical protein BGW80DRAFT_1558760 [Lactifluus volemus]
MFPLKIALRILALASFATFSYASSHSQSESHQLPIMAGKNPKALISDANILLEQALLPFYFINPTNATADSFVPVINQVVEIVNGLIKALRSSSLDGCDCTREDILVLTATTFKVILEPLGIAFSSDRGLSLLLPLLVSNRLGELIHVVLALIGGVVADLVFLLIRNGSVAAILGLNLHGLIGLLGLRGVINVLGHLGHFGRRS